MAVLENYFSEFFRKSLSEDDKDAVQIDQEKHIDFDPDLDKDAERIINALEKDGIPVNSKSFVGKMELEGKTLWLFEPEESEKQELKKILGKDDEYIDTHVFYAAADDGNGGYVFIDPSSGKVVDFRIDEIQDKKAPLEDLYKDKGKEYTRLILANKVYTDRFIVK